MSAPTPSTAELLAADRAHLWHPYTSMADPAPVRLVESASGVRLRIATGPDGETAELVDAMSSWWAAIHGYAVGELDAALADQAGRMAHVMFGGLTHSPAVRLGRRLVEMTPEPLQHVFLADSGSVSVEVALKMALQYQRGRGRPRRTRMLTVYGGYHGDTFDCMSVTDPVGGMHSMWSGLLPQQLFGPRPPLDRRSSSPGEERTRTHRDPEIAAWAEELRALAAAHADELAGLIVEPLLQGAGGMRPYPPECLHVVREIADEHDLVLVFDEIATGFGRTGHLFAGDAAGVAPDVLCLGKALTGGYLTLAAALCTRRVAAGISGSDSGVLMHGPTFMGNPLACAVALASLEKLEADDWRANVRRIEAGLARGLAPLRERPEVSDARTLGAVGVVQLDHPVDGPKAAAAAAEEGVWLRPFRDLIYTMPPYVTTDDDVARICRAVAAAAEVG